MKKENRKSNQRSVIASEVIRSAAISQSYKEIALSSRTPPRNDKTLVSSSFLVLLIFCFLVFPQTTLAAETCCKCQRDAENFCVNLSDVQDCNGAQLKSQSLANVQKGNESLFVGFNCSAALTPTQCRTIAQGGVCGSSPLAPTELINALKAADKQEADDQSSGSSISSQKTPLPPLTKPELGVKIPGLDFSDVRQVEGGFLIIPFLAQYISAAYRYLIGVSVIVAIIVVMYGGFLYMVGSAVSDVKRGKKYIFDA
ncbi:MAG: hypothetical protein Q8R07_05540, partial [Candidatus Uhrbacteria bacterium]|nr:hypothetical protein [Candidatus Uhrbacteria bacterium]